MASYLMSPEDRFWQKVDKRGPFESTIHSLVSGQNWRCLQ